jgi:phospholipid-binding lipoprotein MlaA
VIDTRSDLLSTEELIQGDKYTFIRDVYLQRREFLISDGVIERDAFTDDPLY